MSVTKFNDDTKEKLIYALKKGAPYQLACDYAGITYEIFRQWRKKARANDEKYVAFFEDLKKAEGYTALKWLDVIDKAMDAENWQAAAWKLERRYYKHYGNNPVVREEIKQVEKQHRKIKQKYGDQSHGSQVQKLDKEGSE